MANYPYQVPSGVTIVPEVSGYSSLGTAPLSFDKIYANQVVISGTAVNGAGTFLPIAGGTLTGPLVLSSGMTCTSSGMCNIGTQTNPFGQIWANEVVDLFPAVCGIWTSGNAVATVLTQNVFSIVSGTYFSGTVNAQDFSVTLDPMRITYIGSHPSYLHLNYTCSIASASTNQTGEIAIYKDGNLLPSSKIERRYSSADVGALATQAISLATSGAYYDVRITNTTASNNMTVSYANFTAVGL